MRTTVETVTQFRVGKATFETLQEAQEEVRRLDFYEWCEVKGHSQMDQENWADLLWENRTAVAAMLAP